MTAEPRDVELIRRDLARAESLIADGFDARDTLHMLAMDVEPLLDVLAAGARENAELRGALRESDSRFRTAAELLGERTSQLAAAQAQLAEALNSLEACRNAGQSMQTESDDARERADNLRHDLKQEIDNANKLHARLEAVRARAVAIMSSWNPGDPAYKAAQGLYALALSAAPRPEPDDEERQAMEADAMREPSPSAMLAGIHVTRYRPQDCACRGKHEHRYGYTRDCTVRDCTCSGSPEPPASDEPARCEHGQTSPHAYFDVHANEWIICCPDPAASGTPDGGS